MGQLISSRTSDDVTLKFRFAVLQERDATEQSDQEKWQACEA
jgi:hypothetical protein